MKTITLEGEIQKFGNLNQAMSKFHAESLPYEVETRVYVIDTQNHLNDLAYTDEEFMQQAEDEGRVYTLKGFQEAFNNEEINSAIDVIRFISVPYNYKLNYARNN